LPKKHRNLSKRSNIEGVPTFWPHINLMNLQGFRRKKELEGEVKGGGPESENVTKRLQRREQRGRTPGI